MAALRWERATSFPGSQARVSVFSFWIVSTWGLLAWFWSIFLIPTTSLSSLPIFTFLRRTSVSLV